MDKEAVTKIIENIYSDYDISDSDDITQLIIDLLYTFDKTEFEYALLQFNILKDN
jgi:hypothetical protein